MDRHEQLRGLEAELLKALRAVDKPDMAYGYEGAYKWRSEKIAPDAEALIESLIAKYDRLEEAYNEKQRCLGSTTEQLADALTDNARLQSELAAVRKDYDYQIEAWAENNKRQLAELAEARERAEKAEGCLEKIGKVYSRLVPFVGHEEYDRGWNAAVDEVRGHIRQWRGPQGREGDDK